MIMKKIYKYIFAVAGLLLSVGAMTSCVNDLDLKDGAIDPNLTTEATPEQMFNKCYAVIGVAGNYGANGGSDVDGIDGGTSGYVRQMWNANELTTDEAICCWGDDGIPQFNFNTYDADHPMLAGFYYRLYTAITFCNHYLEKYGDYNEMMTAEVRFLRALDYYFLMDGWGNVPLATTVSADEPRQATRAEVYEFIESELLDIHDKMHAPIALRQGMSDNGWNWGRVDQDACNLLLARLYLNSEVYIGQANYDKAARYAKLVMDGPHKLHTADKTVVIEGDVSDIEYTFSAYRMLFMGDNDLTDASTEAVFPILQDGIRTTSWGTSLFMMASTFDGDMHECPYNSSSTNGTDQGWGGNRARPDLVKKFINSNDIPELACYEMAVLAGDDRALFDSKGRTLDNEDVGTFTNGFAIGKFNNFTTDGSPLSDPSGSWADMDVYLMRVAEAYLNYAEAEVRLHGVTQDAVDKVNALRNRAHARRFTTSTLTLDEILNEWSREFFFEGRRRVDLIRFGYFGGNNGYNWTWKGGSKNGSNFAETRNVFAIPSDDLIANKNLQQNPGY